MKNNNIKLSIIIPTKNRVNYLEEAILSIEKQTFSDYELIIIDDNSKYDYRKMLKKFSNININYIKNNIDLFAHNSRKIGYEKAKGKYIIFMDDDDFYIDNDFFERAINILENDLSISTYIGSTQNFINEKLDKIIDLKCEGKISNEKYLNNFGRKFLKPSSTLTAILRKRTLEKNDFHNCKMINDTCIFLYAIMSGEIYVDNVPVAAYRIHNTNISKRKFEFEFIKLCLNEKKKVYKKLRKDKKLENPFNWFLNQVEISANYFICCSQYDIKTIIYILFWMLIYGKGIIVPYILKSMKRKVKIL